VAAVADAWTRNLHRALFLIIFATKVSRSFADIKITDRKNVDIQVVDTYLHVDITY
jgi:hypothetical protein